MCKFALVTRFRILTRIFALVAFSSSSSIIADAANISAADAIHFVGQIASVCGRVASAKYASDANGQPTFLNLDKPFPNHVFTAVIWGKDRGAFRYAPESLAGRHICVSGTVLLYREKAEIVVSAQDQLKTAN
jgi:hypothetical protein